MIEITMEKYEELLAKATMLKAIKTIVDNTFVSDTDRMKSNILTIRDLLREDDKDA